jgi:DNA-binding MarR family transcriptional regulator
MNDTQTTSRTADGLMFALIGAAHDLEGRLEQGLSNVGLSMAKHGVLKILADAGEPLSLSELATRQACVRSNITQLVDRLEADGLVRRMPDPDDRRGVKAALTAGGIDRQTAGARVIEQVRDDFSRALSEADRAALDRVLSALG